MSCPVVAVLGLLVIMSFPVNFANSIKLLIIIMVCPIIIWCGLTVQLKGLTGKIMDYIGEISYPLYIIHWPLLIIIKELALPLGVVPITLVAVAMSWAVAHLALFSYVVPVRRFLRNRYHGRKSVISPIQTVL